MTKELKAIANRRYGVVITKDNIITNDRVGSTFYDYNSKKIGELRRALKKSPNREHFVNRMCVWHDAWINGDSIKIGCQTFTRTAIQKIIDKFDKLNGRKPTDWSKYGK
jgi:hypothetical protein